MVNKKRDCLGVIRLQKPQRKRVSTNDVVALELAEGGYIFGRAIDGDAVFGAAICLVVYDVLSDSPDPSELLDSLTAGNILIPAVNLNYFDAKSGLVRTVGNFPPGPDSLPDPVCVIRSSDRIGPAAVHFEPKERSFRTADQAIENSRIFDLQGRRVESPSPPYGSVGSAGGLIFNSASIAEFIGAAMGNSDHKS